MQSWWRSWVKRQSSLFTDQSTFQPSPMVMNIGSWPKDRSRIQAAKMSFLHRVAGWSYVTREELGVEPPLLHMERSRLRRLGHLYQMSLRRLPWDIPGMSFRKKVPQKTQEMLEGLCCLVNVWMPWDHPGRAGGSVWRVGSLGITALSSRRSIRRWMDGWILNYQWVTLNILFSTSPNLFSMQQINACHVHPQSLRKSCGKCVHPHEWCKSSN